MLSEQRPHKKCYGHSHSHSSHKGNVRFLHTFMIAHDTFIIAHDTFMIAHDTFMIAHVHEYMSMSESIQSMSMWSRIKSGFPVPVQSCHV